MQAGEAHSHWTPGPTLEYLCVPCFATVHMGNLILWMSTLNSPLRWRKDSRLDCGIPSLCVGPLMARRLRTPSDVPMPMSA